MTMAVPELDSPEQIAGFFVDLFDRKGGVKYGEGVTQTEHAIQSAVHADQQEEGDALVCAALLHDVGHLLHEDGRYHASEGIDAVHETVGAEFLEHFFGPEVTEPVRLHVDAKRYLCAVEPDYFSRLSEASILSLELQGGPMSAEEVNAFEASPHAKAAVALRRIDEAAKAEGLTLPGVGRFAPMIEAMARRAQGS